MINRNKFLLCILCFALFLYILALNPKIVGELQDDGAYIWSAYCLTIARRIWSHLHFRLGFPALLVPILKLFPKFPQNIIPLKAVSTGMTILFLIVVYFFLKNCNYTSKNNALLTTSLTAINPGILNFSVQVMTEMSYSLFVVLAFMFTELETTYSSTKNRFNILLFLVPLFSVFSFLIRRISMFLILSIIIYYLIIILL